MPPVRQRPPPLTVRLRMVEIGNVDQSEINRINEVLPKVFSQKTGWSPRFKEWEDKDQGDELCGHEITFVHRTTGRDFASANQNWTSDLFEKFCEELCKSNGSVSLSKVTTNNNLVFMPYCLENRSILDEIFAQKFVISCLRHSKEGQAYFREIQAVDGSPLTRNSSKWFHAPIQAAVTLCDFFELFRDHVELIPSYQPVQKWPHGITTREIHSGLTEENIARAEVVLKILRVGAEAAPWMRSVVQADNLDKKVIAKAIMETYQKVYSATSQAATSLRDLNAGLEKDTVSVEAIDQSLADLNTSMKETVSLYEASTKDVDRTKGNLVWSCLGTGIAIVGTITLFAVSPPAGSWLAAEIGAGLVACDGLGIAGACTSVGGIVGIAVTGKSAEDAKEFRDKVYKIGDNCNDIWLFLSLVMMRKSGRIPDDDQRLVAFAKLMSKTFNGVDVMNNWNNLAYIRERVDIQMQDMTSIVVAVADKLPTVPPYTPCSEVTDKAGKHGGKTNE